MLRALPTLLAVDGRSVRFSGCRREGAPERANVGSVDACG
jgi:hypothetical protein